MEQETHLKPKYKSFKELKTDLESLFPNISPKEINQKLKEEWTKRKEQNTQEEQKYISDYLNQNLATPKKSTESTKKSKKDSIYEMNKKWFIQAKKGSIEDYYEMTTKEKLGQGGFATTFKVKRKNIDEYRAVKILSKSYVKQNSINLQQFIQEITNMKNLDHPNVIRLYEFFEDRLYIYLVIELCEGGEVLDKIVEHKHFTEEKAKKTFKQVAEAIHYCHLNNISHGDLKPENLMYLNKSEDSPIKIIDFGFSADKSNQNNPICGTSYYMSPELRAFKQDPLADVWAMGIILFIMLCGTPPLNRQTNPQTGKKKWVFSLNFSERSQFDNVSEEAKNLIRFCLKPTTCRYSTEQIIQSPWLQQKDEKEKEQQQKHLQLLQIDKLKTFTKSNQLRKVILTHIATTLKEQDILELQELFKTLDTNQDGMISFDELKQGFQKQSSDQTNSQTWKTLQNVFDNIDTDGSGQLDYTEFIAASLEQSYYLEKERLHYIFEQIDSNKDGYLSLQEIYDYLQQNTKINSQYEQQHQQQQDDNNNKNSINSEHNLDKNQEYFEIVKKELEEADQNSDGKIDFSEFVSMMKPNPNLLLSQQLTQDKNAQELSQDLLLSEQLTQEIPENKLGNLHQKSDVLSQAELNELMHFYSQDKEISQVFEQISKTHSQKLQSANIQNNNNQQPDLETIEEDLQD